jgi:ribose-phosphate pyrophosphokinase
MRQDKRFHPGETISAQHIARMIGDHVDWLVTVDPHLHRITDLSQVYSIPTAAVHAAGCMAAWIQQHINQPLLIGPDEESAQWVSDVAVQADAPFLVLSKVRQGDRQVEVSFSQQDQLDLQKWRGYTPVLIDDMISTAGTMMKTLGYLQQLNRSHQLNMQAPVCVTVHAIFAHSAYENLMAAGAVEVVSCNTILHDSNRIDLSGEVAKACYGFFTQVTD